MWQASRSATLLVSPSDFSRKPSRLPRGEPAAEGRRLAGNVFGTIVHRVLQHWDFGGDMEPQLAAVTVTSLARDVPDDLDQQALLEEIRQLLRTFAGSDPYARLRRARVIGREVPFFMPWNEGRQILEGVIDVLYYLDGKLWIADYKTDMIPLDQVVTRAEAYREQAILYQEAVARSLGEPVAGFEFIFLRHGIAITV